MNMVVNDIELGLESCIDDGADVLQGQKFGLLMNRASVDRDLRLSCDLLNEACPNGLKSLFTPQHGLWGDAEANMIETPSDWHRRLGVPIHSLYCETRRPTPQMLDGLDCFVVDLQDVGTRVYTYIWTVLECMKACAACGVRMLILDRPNPLGGTIVEGRILDSEFTSFVGGATIPMRHGLTLGELARFVHREELVDVKLDVIPLRGWQTDSTFDSLDRPWLPPSPNLPTMESVQVYPGQVLLEGTNLSEGRGTTKPFELLGAPYLEPETLVAELTRLKLPGVHFLPVCFQPNYDKWQGQSCGGVSIHVTDRDSFRPVRTTIAAIELVRSSCNGDFQWLDPPYEYETIKPPIDIIFGSDELRSESLSSEELSHVDAAQWGERSLDAQIYQPSEHRFRS